MAAEQNATPRHLEVDEALAVWRQGDCVLGEQWFVTRVDPAFPLTGSVPDSPDLVERRVAGLVVVTQTCDVVRSCADRPFMEVSPLVEVDSSTLREVERGRRPAFAFLPGLENRRLVADLDRTMTVEKPVVARWDRTPGWTRDSEGRAFAAALARKRQRYAFPDDFADLTRKLQRRLREKHEKDSTEGAALRALREIRVHASPSWNDKSVTLTFWFIREDRDVDFRGKSWTSGLEDWLRLVPSSGRFVEVLGLVVTLDDLTAAEYVGSDPLDLDHLSSRDDDEGAP